jgi:hypothetical protein
MLSVLRRDPILFSVSVTSADTVKQQKEIRAIRTGASGGNFSCQTGQFITVYIRIENNDGKY